MVLVHQDNQRRGSWKLGKVEQLIKGDDHKVRSAIVKVNGEGKKANQLKRPINKLYSLEVRSQDEDKSNSENVPETQANIEQLVQDQQKATPRRRAAVMADMIRKQWIRDEYI